jgi:hypothetical protein
MHQQCRQLLQLLCGQPNRQQCRLALLHTIFKSAHIQQYSQTCGYDNWNVLIAGTNLTGPLPGQWADASAMQAVAAAAVQSAQQATVQARFGTNHFSFFS